MKVLDPVAILFCQKFRMTQKLTPRLRQMTKKLTICLRPTPPQPFLTAPRKGIKTPSSPPDYKNFPCMTTTSSSSLTTSTCHAKSSSLHKHILQKKWSAPRERPCGFRWNKWQRPKAVANRASQRSCNRDIGALQVRICFGNYL
ncbi:hypothetical protein EMPG_10338 [Blastomyces silverae]|uniref:Uncharacterized protein n=1 Tax=Blastomyces silverae TaxID=2060906 RepID=A0A0H1B574_9EURO|nr:hypothetical protein EMPG_10338 [Blastomyces silverae]